MDSRTEALGYELLENHSLAVEDYEHLLRNRDMESARFLADLALSERKRVYGAGIFIRGLIEFTNCCKNDCYYCGLRASNKSCDRYRLTKEQILDCCDSGYKLGFRTFVLQGGEDPMISDDFMCDVIETIKARHTDCAVTLSIGERNRESYASMRASGADRFLLRQEAASPTLYKKLHPGNMSLENRINCLMELRDLGYQIGAGFMVGAPYQTDADVAADLKFIENIKPDMCGIGPFVPHHATPFSGYEGGTVEETCYLISIMRLIYPRMLIPATTALGTIDRKGREKGMLSGANVVMPNLSPAEVRGKYEIYDNKLSSGEEASENLDKLDRSLRRIGFQIVVDRGDIKLDPGGSGETRDLAMAGP